MEKQEVGERDKTGAAVDAGFAVGGSAVGTGSAVGRLLGTQSGKGLDVRHKDCVWYKRHSPLSVSSSSREIDLDKVSECGSAISRSSAVDPDNLGTDDDGVRIFIPDQTLFCKVCKATITSLCDVKAWREEGRRHPWGCSMRC